jgi:hypothetical protein
VEAESGVGRVYKRLSSKPRLFEKPISWRRKPRSPETHRGIPEGQPAYNSNCKATARASWVQCVAEQNSEYWVSAVSSVPCR